MTSHIRNVFRIKINIYRIYSVFSSQVFSDNKKKGSTNRLHVVRSFYSLGFFNLQIAMDSPHKTFQTALTGEI